MIAVTLKKIALGVLVAVLLVGMYSGWLDEPAKEYTEQGLKRVLITYAVARGLNGLISVAQGTEISVEPVGVGMTFTPGQILDHHRCSSRRRPGCICRRFWSSRRQRWLWFWRGCSST